MTAISASGASGVAKAPVGAKVMAFLRLGKARIYHHAYGWLLAVLLLRLDGLVTKQTAAAIALLLLMVEATQFAGGAWDDIGGGPGRRAPPRAPRRRPRPARP